MFMQNSTQHSLDGEQVNELWVDPLFLPQQSAALKKEGVPSRGPWLISGGKEANGVNVVEDDDLAFSPHFTEDMKQENIFTSITYRVQ